MYADDNTIYAIIKNDVDRIKLQNELNNLVSWAAKWQLNINYQKCHIIHFVYKNLNFNYYFENNIITTSHCEKILGVVIENKLSFRNISMIVLIWQVKYAILCLQILST